MSANYVPSAWEPAPTHDQCIYCQSMTNVYLGRCEDCAVTEFDNDNAHGRSPVSRPTNLTPTEVLRAKAIAWLDDNHGTVHIALVESAIRHSDLAGDPFSDNPFRHALIAVATERGAVQS